MMSKLYPENIQCAVLFDRKNAVKVADIIQKFGEVQRAKSSTEYKLLPNNSQNFAMLVGPNELTVTIEFLDEPADLAVFGPTLASSFTQMIIPNALDVISSSKSYILINVRNGITPTTAIPDNYFETLKMQRPGHSIDEFTARLKLCGLITLLTHDLGKSVLIHWGQSDMLFRPGSFEKIVLDETPGIINLHPHSFEVETAAGGQETVGFSTFGAAHFIRREITVRANPIPWLENLLATVFFIRLAWQKNGYVIPNGDVFGPESGECSYRVHHIHETNSGEVQTDARYELELMMHKEHNFLSPDHTSYDNAIDIHSLPPDKLNKHSFEGQAQIEAWEERRKVAEAANVRFEVLERPAPFGGRGRAVFGRRQ